MDAATILLLGVYMLLRSCDVVFVKRAQYENGNFWQNMHFTCIFCALQALILFVIPPYEALHFSPDMLALPALFAFFYVFRMIFMVMAMREGPSSLLQIIISFNTLFPVILGVLFWNETLTWLQILGLVLFCIALPLFNSDSYSEGTVRRPITAKWILYSMLSLFGSGFAVTCTKRYSAVYDGLYIKEYLIAYAVIAALLCLPFVIWAARRHSSDLAMTRSRLGYSAASAFSVDASNVVFMMFIGSFSSALYFPLISVLQVVGVLLCGRLWLKEQVNKKAWIGIALSAVALMLLAFS